VPSQTKTRLRGAKGSSVIARLGAPASREAGPE
jgi:hypothetical protein